jgi:hypothetical protein
MKQRYVAAGQHQRTYKENGKVKSFDRDKFLRTASYRDVCELCPQQLDGVPTLYNPDKSLIYLASFDVDFPTDNAERLKKTLPDLREIYERAKRRGEFKRAWRARTDHLEVCRLLQSLVEDPDEYGDPDELIGEEPGRGL